MSNNLALTSKIVIDEESDSSVLESVTDGDPENSEEPDSDSEETMNENILMSYHEMSQMWLHVVDANKRLTTQVGQLKELNEEHLKKIAVLENDLTESKKTEVVLNAELERLKKTVKMLNSGTTKLDHILTIGKSSGDYAGLGYGGQSSGTKNMFVKASQERKMGS